MVKKEILTEQSLLQKFTVAFFKEEKRQMGDIV
jgi:hypothetical protein